MKKLWNKLKTFLLDVKKEMKKVRWPNRKEMITYSSATVVFIIIFMIFFFGADVLISWLKELFR